MNPEQAVTALAALAQTNRLAVFRWLVERGPDGAHPGEIGSVLDIQPATLSFHLKTLVQAGLVHAQRHGRNIAYRAEFEAMRALVDYLTANCCGGDPGRCLPASAINTFASTCTPEDQS